MVLRNICRIATRMSRLAKRQKMSASGDDALPVPPSIPSSVIVTTPLSTPTTRLSNAEATPTTQSNNAEATPTTRSNNAHATPTTQLHNAEATPTTQLNKAVATAQSSVNVAEALIKLVEDLVVELDKLKFGDPVSYIYNPVVYAKDPHDFFIRKFCNSPKSVLFLGMNPGPFGMAQNGVPFGEANFVRDWMKITGKVGKPPKEHPKRIIVGLDCQRSEVSGTRFWGLWKELCGTPENFFRNCFVYNHCPLVFMSSTSKNVTPPSMKACMRDPLNQVCDEYLCRLIELLGVEVVVGIGKFAAERSKIALKKGGVEDVRVVSLMHPSPINPAANRGWDKIAKQSLEDLDLMKYLKV